MVERLTGQKHSVIGHLGDPIPLQARRATAAVAPPRPHGKVLGGELKRSKLAQVPAMLATHELRLRNDRGEVRIPADNYFLDGVGNFRPEMAELAQVIWRRPPERQAELNRAITEAHAAHEMSFRVKDPETGNYDKIFKVPSYGTVVPLREAHFQKLVASTEPVMRALRQMLQAFYASPDPTAKDLGIDHLPADEQARVLETMKESLYFEPQLVGPAMKDYPFLSVAGFDAAVGNLDAPQPVFFEYNLGTPSGISNNLQLLEILRQEDPELFRTFEKRLPKDETFGILRKAIDSNAAAWTGKPHGISVVLGPGPYNGAHPDVASIAMFSGMPLVLPSDLYQDKNGEIRLNTGVSQKHPVVTGIYGRMEESYFLSDPSLGLPLRSPDHDNVALSQQFGEPLKPGVIYDVKEDEQGNALALRRDADGRPKLQQVYESIGADPSRPDAPRGSFLEAIKSRQLYYSGLGGRVVDDKRVFQAVSRFVAPAFARSAEAPIARPPRTLDLHEYQELYESKNLENFVIKEPDKSGGSGVFLMCNLAPEQRREVVEAVKRAPGDYIVQEFASPAVMTSVEPDPNGKMVYGSLANDWRIFSIMDAAGNVSAGPSSLLLRAAKPYSASTNTSQGAGYGIGLVLADETVSAKKETVLPKLRPVKYVGAGRQRDLLQFVAQLQKLLRAAEPGQFLPRDGEASLLAQHQRDVMDILGRELAPAMTMARRFDAGEIDQATFYRELLELRTRLLEHPGVIEQVAQLLRRGLADHSPAPTPKGPKHDPAVGRALPVVTFKTAEVVRQDEGLAGVVEKIEVGRYEQLPDPIFNDTIRELAAAGGELRAIRLRAADGTLSDDVAGAYFRLDDRGHPIIGVDLGQPRALAALAHERQHFRDWLQQRDQLIAQGVEPQAAAHQALERTNTPEARVAGEGRSLKAELEHETRRSPLNRGAVGPRSLSDPGYIARMLYPEMEGIRDYLHRERWSGEVLPIGPFEALLDRVVNQAVQLRQEAFGRRRDRALLWERSPQANERLEGHREHARAYAELARPIFDLVVERHTEARFVTDQTWEALTQHFEKALARAGLSEDRAAVEQRQQAVGQQ